MNADKRRKLLDLEAMRRRLPHVSQRGLASTLKDIKKHGLPELDDTRDLRAAREMLMNEKTPYGPISVEKEVPASGGGSVRIRMASPLALLFFMFFNCAPFASFLEERLVECPSSYEAPWNLILYCDEVHPGDRLGGKKLRKFHAIYLSFKEFGMAALSHEDMWFTIATVRTQIVNQIPGGMSKVFSIVLRELFVDGPLADIGLVLQHADRTHRFLQNLATSYKMAQPTNRGGTVKAMLVVSCVCCVAIYSVKLPKLLVRRTNSCCVATQRNILISILQTRMISGML